MTSAGYDAGWLTLWVPAATGAALPCKLKGYKYDDGDVSWDLLPIYSFFAGREVRLSKQVAEHNNSREVLCAQLGLESEGLVQPSRRQCEVAGMKCGPRTRESITGTTLCVLLDLVLWSAQCRNKRSHAKGLLKVFLQTMCGDAPATNWQAPLSHPQPCHTTHLPLQQFH